MIILPASTFDGSTTVLVGEKYKGDGYYGRTNGLHTAAWKITGFTGSLKIQGSLAADPTEDDWFDVNLDVNNYELQVDGRITPVVTTSIPYILATQFISYNFTGNFVWVRAAIASWSAGTVNVVYLNK